MSRRVGAYVLPGDPVWLRETLEQYYPMLDRLVIPVPEGGLGWSGVVIPVDECLDIIRSVDVRRIAVQVPGAWVDRDDPMRADTAQRQSALAALVGGVDWVIQLDNDEFLPDPSVIDALLDAAERAGVDAVEIPMRVLFRRTRTNVFEVCGEHGRPHHEYPGPVLVRPGVRLVDGRRAEGGFLRVVIPEADGSLQLQRPPAAGEHRTGGLGAHQAIVHNSWARSPADIRRKTASWGHSGGVTRGVVWFYGATWWPTPLRWRWMRDFHPFARGLWPRLRRIPNRGVVADTPTAS